ncbi:transmembrane emp24 domain-containing protein 1-like [Orbicella faveolata]|uniref:transmembrane emp24 domain-containing protein 1-like n=1 Tax=Orbicella faveolata TaxID=48498 RepID=UPI0009E43510|nr:transmembrane emp24 domain-containing protein 1-like [Orbicella faveolata]
MRLPASCIFLSILLQWLILLPMSRAMLNGFTTVVEAGKVNCFYENISDNKTLEIEYQVIEGGGEMDITFQVVAPSKALLVDDEKKTDEVHSIQAAEDGIYTFCFDNSFSMLAEKIVYVDLGLESDEVDSWLSSLQGDTDTEIQEIQIDSIRVRTS